MRSPTVVMNNLRKLHKTEALIDGEPYTLRGVRVVRWRASG